MSTVDCRKAHAVASQDGKTVTVTMGDGSYQVSAEDYRWGADDEVAPNSNQATDFATFRL